MVGQRFLAPLIEVRVLAPQPKQLDRLIFILYNVSVDQQLNGGENMPQWELVENVDDANAVISERLSVPQGWLLRTMIRGGKSEHIRVHQLLIKDKVHSWKLKKLKRNESRWKEIKESVQDDFTISEYLQVPGGWVVRTYTSSQSDDAGGDGSDDVQQTFISDPEHTWIS